MQRWMELARRAYASPRMVWAIVGLGLLIRLRDFIHNRSLWLDESKIATNLLDRTFAQLLQPLDYEQGGPAAWLFTQKLITLVCGPHEWSLRLLAFVSGSAALCLFPRVARRFLPPLAVPLAVAFFAFSESLLYFTVEAKQYIVDVLFAVLLLAVLPAPTAPVRPARLLPLALIGALAIPFSHPSIFILGAFCVVWGYVDLRGHRPRALVLHGAIGLGWGVLILCNYFFFLRTLGDSEHLMKFWGEGFMPAPWRLHESLPWLVLRSYEMFQTMPLRLKLGAVPGMLVAALGLVALYRRRRMHVALLVLPFLITLAAAAAHKYPFDGRMLMFLAPALLIVVCAGLAELQRRVPRKYAALPALLALGLMAPGLQVAAMTLADGRDTEELRPVMERIQKRIKPGDAIFLGPSVSITWRYYVKHFPERFNFSGYRLMEYDGPDGTITRSLQREAARAPLPERVWVVLTHYRPEERRKFLERLNRIGKKLSDVNPQGSSGYLYAIDSARLAAEQD